MLPSCLYFQIHPEFTMTLLIPSFWMVYRISLNNSRRRFFFFHTKRGDYSREGNYLTEAIILNIVHWKSYFFLFSHEINKWSHQINWTCTFLVLQIWFLDYLSLSISSASELEWSLMGFATPDSTSRSFHLTGRGFKKEKMARRGGGWLFEAGD